jgi:hypothetical protein
MTKSGYKFDEVARSERYYTSFILPLLLTHDNFRLMKELFPAIFKRGNFDKLKDDFEIVTELDPLRDGSVNNANIKKLYDDNKRLAVPDLFLRWDNLIVVIEAKFFTYPTDEEISFQISKQKAAIDLVLPETIYNKVKIVFCALTINPIKSKDFESITWKLIFDLASKVFKSQPDQISYALRILNDAIIRASKPKNPSNVHFKKYNSLSELIEDLPKLLSKKEFYFGFSEGEDELNNMSLSDLNKRSHYRVSNEKFTDNWLSIDQLIKRYIELNSKK